MNVPLKKKNGPRSVKLYWRVIRDMGLPMAILGFLALLKTYAGPLGVIPAGDTIAKDSGINRKTVWKYIAILEKAKLLRRVPRLDSDTGKRTSNCYLLDDEQIATLMATNALAHVPKNGTWPYCPKKRDSNTSEQEGTSTVREDPPNVIRLKA